jgi:gamma-glutamyl hydrolase
MRVAQLPALFLLIVLVLVRLGSVTALPTQPANPIVGILSEPVTYGECVSVYRDILSGKLGESKVAQKPMDMRRVTVGAGMETFAPTTLPPMPNGSGCIWSLYVDWLEASAIRVVPIPWDMPERDMLKLLGKLNGVLFAGGIAGWNPTVHSDFFKVAQRIYDYVVERNEAGDPMVLWGICQGFEMVNAAAARNFSVVEWGFQGMDPLMMSLNFTSFASSSRMWGEASPTLRSYATNLKTQLNWHMLGVPPTQFLTNTRLNASGVQPLSTTNDVNGHTFVSSIESIPALEIYGTQFHPERVMFQFSSDAIGHSREAIELAQYLSRFLRSRVGLNNHTFDTPEEANGYLIENYPRYDLGWGVRIYNV